MLVLDLSGVDFFGLSRVNALIAVQAEADERSSGQLRLCVV
ncbi:hypothetical protein [Saccharothrix violaceirubra]|uniref:Anti-anti-sigma regulatory factor n=1 Tax=Saccharothrix violaceirubra TaxID=413306 RepID=A0A7W7WX72_9PSEU|nr:hypothetical protein [Saccharothrix violaceirubra]MBB4966782.1 anti-anti-sigma regulatory factor [Saccharothrix violaceirubra]